MRNLKKFLAVLVVVAMMATSMMSAFAAADPAMTPAEKAEGLGLLKGGADGKVDEAYLNLTTQRIQTAIIYLRLMGKEAEARAYTATTDNFADSNLVSGDAVNLLAYLRANPQLGWVGDGTNFNPLGEVSGQALYKVMLTAVGYTQGLDFDYADTIGFARAKGFSLAAYVGYADSVTNNGMAAAMIEALGTNMNGKTTTLAAKLVADKVITEADASKYTSYVVAPTPTPVPVSAFAITSVTATDLKSATVKFNMAVDATEGAKAANYKVNDVVAANVVLAADKMSAVVTLGTAVAQLGTMKVVLAKAAIASTATADATLTSAAISDTTMPTVKSVVVTGNKLLKITYSEPVTGADYLGNFTIDGAVYSAMAPVVSADGLTTSLTLTQLLATGAHKVVVSSAVKDYAQMPVAPNSTEVTVATDATAPKTVTLKGDATQTQVVVNFDKAIASIGSVKAGSLAADSVTIDGTDQTKVTVKFLYTSPMPASTSTLTFTDVTDYYGNKATLTLSVTPVLDAVRPTFVAIAQQSDKEFTVEYSKEVVLASGTYTLKNKDGVVVPVTVSEFSEGTPAAVNAKKVKLAPTDGSKIDDTSKGPWTLEIKGVTDNTALRNVLVDYTATATFVDKTAPKLLPDPAPAFANYLATAKNVVYFTFDSALDSATATTAANYTLVKAGIVSALPSTAAIALLSDNKTVKITFASDFDISTYNSVSVGGVKDVALNAMAATSATVNPMGAAAQATFGATNVKVTGKNTLTITLATGTLAASTIVPYDFVITNGTDTLVATKATYDAGVITLTTAQDMNSDGTYTGTKTAGIKVYTVAQDSVVSKDIYGTKLLAVASPGIAVVDGYAPFASAVSVAYVKDTTAASDVKIKVTLSEPVTVANNLANEFTVTVGGVNVTSKTTVAIDGSALFFTVDGSVATGVGFTANKLGATYTVTFSPTATTAMIDGIATNYLKAFTFSGTLTAAP